MQGVVKSSQFVPSAAVKEGVEEIAIGNLGFNVTGIGLLQLSLERINGWKRSGAAGLNLPPVLRPFNMKSRGRSTTSELAVLLICWQLCLTSRQVAEGLVPDEDHDSVCQNLAPSPFLEQFVDELPILNSIQISDGKQLTLGAFKIKRKLHRDLPPTTLYAYGRDQATATYPGPTLEAIRGVESYLRWENHIHDARHMLSVDSSIMWANPHQGGVPMVTHLHGGEVDSASDGYPDSWYTAKGDHGHTFTTRNYTYANSQRPTMLWYHDHSFGITRLNVLSGMTGLYFIRPKGKMPSWMPTGKYEVPLLLQDKQFFANGSINFPNVGDSPKIHPNWCPEYFADTILMNGKVWPYLRVEPRKYRFRLLNAANARVFMLSLNDPMVSFIQIGTDGGLLEKPQIPSTLTIAPAERIDLVIDFSKVAGCEVILNNSGPAPFPSGSPAFSPPGTKGVMKFIVEGANSQKPEEDVPVPSKLRKADPPINIEKASLRTNFMIEIDDETNSPLYSLLSNHTWRDPVTEKPEVGSTEVWEFVNYTPDAHPMHIHLVQFRFVNQQSFHLTRLQAGDCTFDSPFPDPKSCFTEEPKGPAPNQIGWKDTILSWPGNVTRLALKWTPQDGGDFPFDATSGPGYVWHCHILDHEDNDMMRPFQMQKKAVH